jgi:hypothetical protein
MSLRNRTYYLAFIVTALILCASAAAAQTQITFARGATQATARGYLHGQNDAAIFLLRARAGQHRRVEIAGRGGTHGVVIFPSGKQDGGPRGVVFDDDINEAGDYRISVTKSSIADAWSGSFTIKVDVVNRSTPHEKLTMRSMSTGTN